MKVSKDRRRQCNEENTHCDERLITPSGLVFVGQILGKSSFVKKINRAPHLYWYALSGKTPV